MICWFKNVTIGLNIVEFSLNYFLFSGNFYNHLITYTDGNIALTIQTTVDNFDMTAPEDFDDTLETLDENLQEPVYGLLDTLDDLGE